MASGLPYPTAETCMRASRRYLFNPLPTQATRHTARNRFLVTRESGDAALPPTDARNQLATGAARPRLPIYVQLQLEFGGTPSADGSQSSFKWTLLLSLHTQSAVSIPSYIHYAIISITCFSSLGAPREHRHSPLHRPAKWPTRYARTPHFPIWVADPECMPSGHRRHPSNCHSPRVQPTVSQHQPTTDDRSHGQGISRRIPPALDTLPSADTSIELYRFQKCMEIAHRRMNGCSS